MDAIYTVASNVSVAADGTIPVGSIVRRVGRYMGIEGSGIACCGRGYYDVTVNVTMSPDAAGVIGIRLYQDGNPVTGGVTMGTGVLNSPLNLTIAPIARLSQCDTTTFSVALDSDGTATGALVENMTVRIEKITR